jgi:hypothetical protein
MKRLPLGGLLLASAVAAGDGVASSADVNAGRSWHSGSVSYVGAPNIDWGWAPAVQVVTLGTGIVSSAMGIPGGRALYCTGLALMSRAAAFYLAQRGQASPAAAQGMFPSDGEGTRFPTQREHFVSQGPVGALAHGIAIDQQVGSVA